MDWNGLQEASNYIIRRLDEEKEGRTGCGCVGSEGEHKGRTDGFFFFFFLLAN
jgi:hypothetical protein